MQSTVLVLTALRRALKITAGTTVLFFLYCTANCTQPFWAGRTSSERYGKKVNRGPLGHRRVCGRRRAAIGGVAKVGQ